MSSVSLLHINVFQKEIQLINSQIAALSSVDHQDITDARLAQEEIWELEEVRKYFERRVTELS